MGKEKFTYDAEHINGIMATYDTGAEHIETIVKSLENARDIIDAAYEGQAKVHAVETFDKIIEHLNLLGVCCKSNRDYAGKSLKNMQAADGK